MINRTQESIMMLWPPNSNEKPLVSVRCIAYNQQDYIEQTLDGFLLQKTVFPFEIVVHDDASSDKTAEIIHKYEKEYPLIIKPIYEKENQYSKHDDTITKIVNSQIKGKYIASCEGDDYWIDEEKLQKQVSFLEENPEYGMCFTNFNMYYQNNGKYVKDLFTTQRDSFPNEYTLETWITERGYVAPMTWVYKKELMDTFQVLPSCDGTFVQFAHFLASGKVKCFEDETTAVYRVLLDSESHSSDANKTYQRQKDLMETQKVLIDKYHLSEAFKSKVEKAFYTNSYKLFCILNKTEDLEAAKKYYHSIKYKCLRIACMSSLIRKVLLKIYAIKKG